MSSALRVVSSHTTIKNASQKMASRDRHCADFPPSAWGEYFIRYSNNVRQFLNISDIFDATVRTYIHLENETCDYQFEALKGTFGERVFI